MEFKPVHFILIGMILGVLAFDGVLIGGAIDYALNDSRRHEEVVAAQAKELFASVTPTPGPLAPLADVSAVSPKAAPARDAAEEKALAEFDAFIIESSARRLAENDIGLISGDIDTGASGSAAGLSTERVKKADEADMEPMEAYTISGVSAFSDSADKASARVYWLPIGKTYHFSNDCSALSRSNIVLSGTADDARTKGKTQPCPYCAE